jgi:acyl transferase domain-containing protein
LAEPPGGPEPATGAGHDREATNEPIAISAASAACFPARTTRLRSGSCRDGVDANREVSADRFDRRAFCDPAPAAPGKMHARWRGFLLLGLVAPLLV